MTNPAISIQNVSKNFGQKHVLKNLSMSINQGTTYAFLGRNGEGKTTTLRMLMGLLKPTTGSISVLNLNPLTHATQLRQNVGYETAITLDSPAPLIQILQQNNHPHTLQNLNLDEIFEAFVTSENASSGDSSGDSGDSGVKSSPPIEPQQLEMSRATL